VQVCGFLWKLARALHGEDSHRPATERIATVINIAEAESLQNLPRMLPSYQFELRFPPLSESGLAVNIHLTAL
jgi:hypothetical protein